MSASNCANRNTPERNCTLFWTTDFFYLLWSDSRPDQVDGFSTDDILRQSRQTLSAGLPLILKSKRGGLESTWSQHGRSFCSVLSSGVSP